MKKKSMTLLTFIVFILVMGCTAVPRHAPPVVEYEPVMPITPIAEEPAQPAEAAIAATTIREMERRPMIALTFDDGPSRFTDSILDVLEKHGGRATFFVLGRFVEPWQNTIIRAVNNGNEVVSHTWSHRSLPSLDNQTIRETLLSTCAIIEQVTGVPRRPFFRPPYGDINRRVVDVAAELGYSIVNWTLDTADWRHLNSDMVYDIVMNNVSEGAIILMHDIFRTTAAAMERLIPSLINEGYQLVTVSELLNHFHGPMQPGRIYGRPQL
jgi:peptidoglycan/xylan/chitin deacetylase (PgdA/CDA1 family)